jgi:ABC-type transport system involved in multi-copper enzyme maturation permease subunit
MASALWIAYLSWLESLRRRFFWISLAMSLLLLLLPAYVNAFSMGLQAFEVVAMEFGLTLMGLFSTSLALLLGCTAIPRDVERGSLHPLLCRPIARLSYVLGQWLGVLLQLTAMLVLGGAALMLGMFALNRQIELGIASAVFGLILESSLLAAVALAASTVASPPLAAVVACFVYLIGGMPDDFIDFFLRDDRGAPQLASSVEWLKSLMPHFEIFRLRYPVVHHYFILPAYYLGQASYWLGWNAVMLLLAGIRFERRDF